LQQAKFHIFTFLRPKLTKFEYLLRPIQELIIKEDYSLS